MSKSIVPTIVLAAALILGGCATRPEPFDYPADNELKKGPGLFSGDDGVFTIYREPVEPEASESSATGKNQPNGALDPSEPK